MILGRHIVVAATFLGKDGADTDIFAVAIRRVMPALDV